MIETLIGLDIGTTTTKAVLFDSAGKELASQSSAPYPIYTPNPGWIEQDAEDIWHAVRDAIQGVLTKVNEPFHVLAICIAAQSGSLIPVDDQGNPVYRLITWMDGRTAGLVKQWQIEGLQTRVKAICGWSLYPGLCLPTIAWLRQHMPDVFKKTRYFLSVNDFIVYRLTGHRITNPSNAGGMQLADIHSGKWSAELCALAGISQDQLSPIQPAAKILGTVLSDRFELSDHLSETILVNGGHDQGCTAVGLGLISPGKMLLACGTAWVITGVITSPGQNNIPSLLDINFHAAPNLWTISQSLGGLGASLEWWSKQAWKGIEGQVAREEIYRGLNAELEESTGGADGLYFLPVTGGHSGPATTQKGGFVGLQLSHTRGDMARAILEGAAFELRWCLDNIRSAGLPVNNLWMVGGAANSTEWPKILASVTNTTLHLPQYDNWPALGAALLGGLGSGIFNSIKEGLNRFQRPTYTVDPDQPQAVAYDNSFNEYREYVTNNENLLSAK
ncbi:MAG: FGGY family carbohydrate kinase [Candidatus Promineifilaceae bacterium]|nr:FGGY family carbohydrate kinase [Candidatus Promineifilaceae bacterium]